MNAVWLNTSKKTTEFTEQNNNKRGGEEVGNFINEGSNRYSHIYVYASALHFICYQKKKKKR